MAQEPFLVGGWLFTGQYESGEKIRIQFSEIELSRASDGLVVGRHPALCDYTLDEPSVSRRHFRISLRDAEPSIEDLNSLNGTLVEGEDTQPFVPVTLRDGQRLALGRVELTVERIG